MNGMISLNMGVKIAISLNMYEAITQGLCGRIWKNAMAGHIPFGVGGVKTLSGLMTLSGINRFFFFGQPKDPKW